MPSFPLVPALAVLIGVAVPLWGWIGRGREYGIWGVIILTVSLPGAVALHARLVGWLDPTAAAVIHWGTVYGLCAGGLHLAALVNARLRQRWFRWLVSIPGMAFVATGFLAGPWLLVLWPVRALCGLAGLDGALAALRWLDLVPIVVVALSVVTSMRAVSEVVRIPLGGDGPPAPARVPVERWRRREPAPLPDRPLRIVQITDPHLGPWQPVHRLRRRIAQLVAQDPDLVLLTGDFLTMEGAGTPGALAEAFAPLRDLAGRCYAVFGNHDHESPDEVRHALAANGVRLLVDEEVVVETAVGVVQIVGADYVGRGRREHLSALFARIPRREGALRLLMLHDPSAWKHVPHGEADLTLSGHTHGGQLGLVSFGLQWTVLARTPWPDHGLFAHGPNRLYVHRGTGFYGFPLRIGVPGEASVLELVLAG
jgi:predicted MPP superfamily phosphohydrolase